MANVFKPKRSSTASSVPTTTDLVDGELAVNSSDQKIYLREGSNIVEVGNASPYIKANTLNVSGVSTFTGDVSFGSTATFGDFDKLNFGDGNDLQIFHNPNNGNSVISEFGSGNLHINADHLQIKNSGATELKAKFLTNGAVELYHDNSKKFETVGTGVSVTGNISVGSTTNIIRKVTDINSWVAVDADTSFSVTSQQNAPTGLYFKSDGTKMFVVGTQSPRDVDEYALSTAWDITTASHTTGYSINSQDTGPQGLYFSKWGKYVRCSTAIKVIVYFIIL